MHHPFRSRLIRVARRSSAYARLSTLVLSGLLSAAYPALSQRSSAPILPPPPSSSGSVAVTTYHNDNARTGANLREAVLSPKIVATPQFGLLFSMPVDGQVYAQPLYLSRVRVPFNGVHNLVFVATEHNSVYAFDPDRPGAPPIWQVSLNGQNETSVPSDDTLSADIQPEVGITGTPVINPDTQTLYVVAKSKFTDPLTQAVSYVQRLHALDAGTGAEKPNSPVAIAATVRGTGDGNDGNGNVPFDPLIEHQRPALLLSTGLILHPNGIVYVGYASHGDNGPYHGWLLGYDAQTLQQVSVLNTTPNASTLGGYPLAAGGIWMSGGGPAADSMGQIFFSTGNGAFDPLTGAFGDSLLKLAVNPVTAASSVADYFTPFDQDYLNNSDLDLGSGGVTLLPDAFGFPGHRSLLAAAGKTGRIYLVDRSNLGRNQATGDAQIVNSISFGAPNGSFGTSAYFNRNLYIGGVQDAIHSYSYRSLRGMPFNIASFTDLTKIIALNGSAVIDSSTKIQLTDGKANETSSAYWPNRVNASSFIATFQIQFTDPNAQGVTFVLQNNLARTMGYGGDGLGYQGIGASVAVKFSQANSGSQNANSTGLYVNGLPPFGADTDLTPTGINFAAGNPIQVQLFYDGKILTVTLQDTKTNATASQFYRIDIAGTLGSKLAFEGFTASTNGTVPTGTPKTEVLAWRHRCTDVYGFGLAELAISPSDYTYPSATPSISANGIQNGIVWAVASYAVSSNPQDPNAPIIQYAALHAYDAVNLKSLYNAVANGDIPAVYVKFSVPTVVNGKVFVGTADRINVYGIKPPIGIGPASSN